MSGLAGYVGSPDKIRKYFGRDKKIVNRSDDLKKVRDLLNNIPSDSGGPLLPLGDVEDDRDRIILSIGRFQKAHGIVNRRTKKAYGWTGPRGQTLAAMNRIALRASRPVRKQGFLDVSRLRYATVERYHYDPRKFRERAGDHVFSSQGTLNDENKKDPVNTCALRVSYAILKAGKRLRKTRFSWKYQVGSRTNWFTSTAKRLANEVANGEFVVSKRDFVGRKGIIAFLGGVNRATGHITLWDGRKCHFDGKVKDAYWESPTIYFFEMKG